MKKDYTVVISMRVGRYDSLPQIQRVRAESPDAIYKYYNGAATHIFIGHPELDGEKGEEEFLKVLEI